MSIDITKEQAGPLKTGPPSRPVGAAPRRKRQPPPEEYPGGGWSTALNLSWIAAGSAGEGQLNGGPGLDGPVGGLDDFQYAAPVVVILDWLAPGLDGIDEVGNLVVEG